MFCERNIPLERENVYQFVKKKLEGPGTIIFEIKSNESGWKRQNETFFIKEKDVKSTAVARIGCTPCPLMVKHAYGRCPTRTQLSTRPLVTGHMWRRNTPKVLKKWGKVIMVGSRRVFILFLILGRRADHPMIFHIFPYLFYHRFSVSNCSKFCVKRMGSTVLPWPKKKRPLRLCIKSKPCSNHAISAWSGDWHGDAAGRDFAHRCTPKRNQAWFFDIPW